VKTVSGKAVGHSLA